MFPKVPQKLSMKPRAIPTYKGLTPLQICEAEGYDPFVAQIKLCKMRVTVRDKDNKPLIDPKTGEPETRPFLEPRLLIEANRSLMDFVRPRMRTQEVKEQLDVNFTWTINRFEDRKEIPPTEKVLEIPNVK